MAGEPNTELDLSSPRTIAQVLASAFSLYARLPLLFILLAAIVVVPYEVAIVLVVHSRRVAVSTELVLALVDLALVDPCIAALQVQALFDLGEGQRPHIPSVIRRALRVLPVVAAAEIVAGLAEGIGLFFFIIPGVIIAVRLAVAAQAAAAERTDWPSALRRSNALTRGNFWHVFALVLIAYALTDLGAAIIGGGSSLTATVVGVVVAVLAHSFGTLLITLLYFDLRAREALRVG